MDGLSCVLGFVIGFFIFIAAWNAVRKAKKNSPPPVSDKKEREPLPADSSFCGQCGTAMKKDDAFCGSCGAPVS